MASRKQQKRKVVESVEGEGEEYGVSSVGAIGMLNDSERVRGEVEGKADLIAEMDLLKTQIFDYSKDMKALQVLLEDYNHSIANSKGSSLLGEIVGYNCFNLYSDFVDMYQLKEEKEGEVVKYSFSARDEEGNDVTLEIPAEEIENVKRIAAEAGNLIHLFVYKREKGWFIFKKVEEAGVLCFDDQVKGINDRSGRVTLLAPGMESLGFYFETPSGYPDRTKVVATYIKNLTYLRLTFQTLGNIFNIVDNALTFNSDLIKTLAVKSADKPEAKK